jgi:hypothetical protein
MMETAAKVESMPAWPRPPKSTLVLFIMKEAGSQAPAWQKARRMLATLLLHRPKQIARGLARLVMRHDGVGRVGSAHHGVAGIGDKTQSHQMAAIATGAKFFARALLAEPASRIWHASEKERC